MKNVLVFLRNICVMFLVTLISGSVFASQDARGSWRFAPGGGFYYPPLNDDLTAAGDGRGLITGSGQGINFDWGISIGRMLSDKFGVGVFIGDIFNKQQNQYIILVL